MHNVARTFLKGGYKQRTAQQSLDTCDRRGVSMNRKRNLLMMNEHALTYAWIYLQGRRPALQYAQ